MRYRLALVAVLPAACVLLGWPAIDSSEILKKHNTLGEIDRAAGKIEMKLVREWGGENEIDINKMLYEPMDVACDQNGHVYLMEALKIRVFDKDAKFVKQMGGPGQGPGEFLRAYYIDIDSKNTLAVLDSDNQRIQILDINGRIIGNIPLGLYQSGPFLLTDREQILLINTTQTMELSSLWQLYDYQGKLVREVGLRPASKSAQANYFRSTCGMAKDDSNRIYVAATYQPVVRVYSPAGDMDREISYELPFVVPELKSSIRGGLEYMDKETACRGIAVDSKKRIFVLALRKLMVGEERWIGGTFSVRGFDGGARTSHRAKVSVDPSTSDLYQILVFDASGKIVSSNKLDFYANQIRIFGNRLFLIDSYINMSIREYLITN